MKKENQIPDSFFTKRIKNKKKYLVLPNINYPRLIIPIQSWKFFIRGLGVQNTASKKNRIIKLLLTFFYPFIKFYYKHQVSLNSDLESSLLNILEQLKINNVYEFAFYIGTAHSLNRKITILILDKTGKSIGILKLPLSKKSSKFIKNEYNTLNLLARYKFSSIKLPSKFQIVLSNVNEILFEENIFLNSSKFKNKLNFNVIKASLELSQLTKAKDTENYLNNIIELFKNYNLDNSLLMEINKHAQLILKQNVSTVRIHGDYVLYNMQLANSKLALIDWEYSRTGLPLFDIFHFVFQGKYQIEKREVKKCIQEVFNESNIKYYEQYLQNLLINKSLIKSLFIFYLVNEFIFERKIKPGVDFAESYYYQALQKTINNYD